MKNYLSRNLTAKLFLIVCTTLIAASLFICGLFLLIMPASYIQLRDEEFSINLQNLTEDISLKKYNDALVAIENFSNEFDVHIELHSLENGNAKSFGVLQEEIHVSVTAMGENTIISEDMVASYAYEVLIENKKYALMITGENYKTENEVYIILQQVIPVIITIMIILSLITAFFLSNFITKPIKEINENAKKISELDFKIFCDESREDELGELSKTINSISNKLDNSLTSLKEELKKTKDLEESQRLFFASASHELKTPLTIIKGNLEGMLYGYKEYENKEKYIAKTLRTSSQMENLISEILNFSAVNNQDYKMELEEFDVKDVMLEIIDSYNELSEVKNFKVNLKLSSVIIFADKKLFKKAVSNIFSNALHYSPENESILINIQKDKLLIENTGITISDDDIDKLFNPFYRVDKSRNRQTGGSGLGLHFVKMILDKHNYKYKISGNENSVKFEIIYKKYI